MPQFKYKYACKVTDAVMYVYASKPQTADKVMSAIVKNIKDWHKGELDKEQANATMRARAK